MKKIMSLMLAGLIGMSSCGVFAMSVDSVSSATKNKPVAEPIMVTPIEMVLPFEVTIEGNVFELKIDENPTTGYEWHYQINKADHVKFVQTAYEAPETTLVGAGGYRLMTFEVQDDGVSTITLSLKRSWEEEVIETIEVLVYKNGDKVFIEEDQIVTIQEEVMDLTESLKKDIELVEVATKLEDEINIIINRPVLENNVLMLPLAETLRHLGYEVKWNAETSSVEVIQGAQWTSLKGGVNAYTKNRMAAIELSMAPMYINGVTYVPAEFFSAVLDLSFTVDSGDIMISNGMMASHEGFIKEINYDETGTMSLTLTTDMTSDNPSDWTIIHTSDAYTYYQKEIEVGTYVKTVSPMMMTMSLPGQTSAYIVY